jgi:hypothetical protein
MDEEILSIWVLQISPYLLGIRTTEYEKARISLGWNKIILANLQMQPME